MRKLRKEVKERKEELAEKYRQKIDHLGNVRRKEEEKRKSRVEIPDEIKIYKDCIIFDEERFSSMKEAETGRKTIGKVELDEDEKAALSLPPNFAIMKFLDGTVPILRV